MIYEFNRTWYDYVVTQKFPLRSLNQSAARPWGGAGPSISGPHTQIFLSDVTMAPMRDPLLQDIGAMFKRLRGRSGLLRLSWALRLAPWHDRNLAASTVGFSDGSTWLDGSEWINGLLPPSVYVAEAAAAGADYIVLGGFPASTANVLRGDDMLEIKPGGVAAGFPHCYAVAYGGDTNASGEIGFKIEPRLRAGIAAGDVVSLRYPSSVFRLVDDNQADIEATGAEIGNIGFSVMEALDLVP